MSKTIYTQDEDAPVIVKDILDFTGENHHMYFQEQRQFKTIFMRNNHIYRRCFSLLKDAIDYRDAALKLSPTPKSRGYARGGNTKPFHRNFCIFVDFSTIWRVILTTTQGKIRKSFASVEQARAWRDSEIRRRGVVDCDKKYPDRIQSYSCIGDKSAVWADSDNIRDKLDKIDFDAWEEFKNESRY